MMKVTGNSRYRRHRCACDAFDCLACCAASTVDSQKFASLTSEGVLQDFAQGLPVAERKLVFAVQGQSFGPMFDEKLTVAAWKTKPSWVIVSANDRMLPPAMEHASGKMVGATAVTLSTCHLAMLEQPDKVAVVIDRAAKESLKRADRSGA